MLPDKDRWLHRVFAAAAVAMVALMAVAIERDRQRLPQIHQRVLPALGVIDRCESCHDAAAHSEPWLSQHPVEQFACTPCHGGQGLATTAPAAHRRSPDWERPLFTALEQQAACGRCHRQGEVPGAPLLSAGRKALAERGCGACHAGVQGLTVPPAPDLDGLAQKTSPGWLRAWLRDPKALDAAQRMPHFRLDDAQIEALVAHLWAQPAVALAAAPTELSGDAERGRIALATRRCATCHTYEGRGGTLGPDLSLAGHKLQAPWTFALLRDTHQLRPRSPMPGFALAAQEALDISAYAQEQWVADSGVAPWASLERPVRPELAAQGKQLFGELGCAGCHHLGAGGPQLPVGPALDALAQRRPEDLPRAATATAPPDVPSYVAAKVIDPKAFDLPGQPQSRMPTPVAVDRALAQALGVAVAALAPAEVPPSYLRQAAPPASPLPPGRVGELATRYRCLTCHALQGQGGQLARVALDGVGSRLQQRWLERFLREPVTVRMDQPERMPLMDLSAADARLLAGWLMAVSADPRVTAQPPLDPAQIPRGKALFAEHRCGACHVADGGGTMKGPTLDGAGLRLQADYTVALLHQGAALVPEGRHPAGQWSLADARAMAAYVLSLPGPWPWPEGGSDEHAP